MNRKHPGFTLLELIVSMALGLLILGLLISLFIQFRRESEQPLASMDMEQSTIYMMRWLQRELTETNLQSIRTLPNDTGMALESARDAVTPNEDRLSFTQIGTVQWKKFVYFQVKPIAAPLTPPPPHVKVGSAILNNPKLGELTCDEDTAGVGIESSKPPLPPPAGLPGRHRVLARNFLVDTTAPGSSGFKIYWTDDAGNPQGFGDLPTQRREPVCLALTLMEVSSRTGQPTVRKIFMQVKPKN